MEEIMTLPLPYISVSVVSHGQLGMIVNLMHDIQTHCQSQSLEFLLTLNIDETVDFDVGSFFYPVKVIKNQTPKGFGANHNQAFNNSAGQLFCVVNPDIRFESCPFGVLSSSLSKLKLGVVAPVVRGPAGQIEDSVRQFPTPREILGKACGKSRESKYILRGEVVFPDWVGGMCMMFPRSVFSLLQGFDERYFLYYEDVDICARLNLAGFPVAVLPECTVVHHAQRSSHRSVRYLRWHISSMMRFFMSPVYMELKRLGRL
jgi:N-acetylglucosaminyl-diphospho-decaprenol L-rhamnosyltransferase